MKCDNCDSEATVHEVMIRGGKKVEKHLCEQCALKEGVGVQAAAPIAKILTQFVTAHGQAVVGGGKGRKALAAAAMACPTCGLSFGQFRKTGLLGCPDCYEAFAEQLSPLLERAHEGGAHHVGKSPPEAGGAGAAGGRIARRIAEAEAHQEQARRQAEEAEARRARIATLERRLEEAVAAEQYERAAKLRDELQRLTGEGGQSGAGGAEPGPGESADG